MPNTPRGYPIFEGNTAPAGFVQLQQVAEAIDADVTETVAELKGRPETYIGDPIVTITQTSGQFVPYPPEVVAALDGQVPTPHVTIGDVSTGGTVQPRKSSMTTNGFDVVLRNPAGSAITGTVRISYILSYVNTLA